MHRIFLIMFALVMMAPHTMAESDEPKAIHTQLNTMTDDLDAEQMDHVYTIYNGYNLIAVYKTVRRDVSAAVGQCGENNPDLKDKMDARLAEWKGTTEPAMEEAQGQLENSILVQDFVPKEAFDTLFELVDAQRDEDESQIDKIPVTTEEACLFLLGKMEETEKSMLGLLRTAAQSSSHDHDHHHQYDHEEMYVPIQEEL